MGGDWAPARSPEPRREKRGGEEVVLHDPHLHLLLKARNPSILEWVVTAAITTAIYSGYSKEKMVGATLLGRPSPGYAEPL